MTPVFVRLRHIGAYAQRFGCTAVALGIVEEQRTGRIGSCLCQYLSEDGDIRLGKFHLVGEEDAVEEIFYSVTIIGEDMAE